MGNSWRFDRRNWTEAGDAQADRTDDNPARGFYHVYTYDITEQEVEEDWVWSLQTGERLALVLLDIGKCADRALTETELAKAARIFSLFMAHGMQMIVRVVYDREGLGFQREPRTIGQVLFHMRQLAPVIMAFAQHILTIQGLFVGSWGEMHSSRYLGKEQLRLLYETLRDETKGCVAVSVRKPQYQRLLGGADGTVCTGLYDDAILASATDMGTFGWIDDASDREIMWTPRLELDFIREQAKRTLCGGEVLAGALALPWETVVQRMEDMQLTYLNRVHEPAVWEQWDRLCCKDAAGGQWTRRSYIRAHLGYRYVLEDVEILCGASHPEEVRVTVKNTGFARCYDALRLELALGKLCVKTDISGAMPAPGRCAALRVQPDGAVWEALLDAACSRAVPVRLALFHEKTGQPVYFANTFSGARRWERYRESSSLPEGVTVGVLSMEKDAAS